MIFVEDFECVFEIFVVFCGESVLPGEGGGGGWFGGSGGLCFGGSGHKICNIYSSGVSE